MNVVDSSAWLTYFKGGRNASYFAEPVECLEDLVVPTITLTEVFKVIARDRDPETAMVYTAHMLEGRVVPLDESLAVAAAELGLVHKLPLADSIVYSTAKRFDALVWTQDSDFEGLDGVRFRAAQR